jgi:HEAT repeat protein
MRFVPNEVQQVLRAVSAKPPASIADFDWIESFNCRAEFFRGLTDDQIVQKIKADKDSRKQRWLEGVRAVHRYFSDSQAKDVDALCAELDALPNGEARAPLLIRLLDLSGHERHEDIVFELGLLGEPAAVPAVLRAALQPFPYIEEWGNLHEFQRKCAYALARIGTSESRIALEQLAKHSDPHLREYGEEGLSKWPLPFRPR